MLYFRRIADWTAGIAHPIAGFGLALLLVVWGATWHQINSENETIERNIAQDLNNLALVVEQSAAKVLDEGDRTLRFLRSSYERNGFQFDWSTFHQEDSRLSVQFAFISVLDATGTFLYSSGYGTEIRPFKVSDREYFLAQREAKEDKLHISKTLRSRRDGSWQFYLSRRFQNADGSFGGVLVAGIDPGQLVKGYHALRLGRGSGVAIVGADGLVRAGTGAFAEDVARGFKEGQRYGGEDNAEAGTGLIRERFKGERRTIVYRPIGEHPLLTMVMASGNQYAADWERNRRLYISYATALSLLVLLAVFASIGKHRRQEREIKRLVYFDSLTQVANRAGFAAALDQAYASLDSGQPFALHIVDLDGFKGVNDCHGHPVGDKLLQAVADRLRQSVRPRDQIARLGGDEFAIIQRQLAGDDDAAQLARRICRVLSREFEVDGDRLQIGASIGIAHACSGPLGAAEVVRRADIALYSAKGRGRGSYRIYSEDLDATLRAEKEMESRLDEALPSGQLELHYQPIVALQTAHITGYEALLRWRHPELGLVRPGDFVPLAEKSGKIVPIGNWVLQQACRDLATLPEDVKISVNASAVQLKSGTFVMAVESALRASGLTPSRLVIEITETAMLESSEANIAQLDALRKLGVKIAVDDFGAGYSSINYLQRFPIDCIKIDQSFVRGLGVCRKAEACVRAINLLAQGLGVSTIAEGVETEAQREALIRLGGTVGQGFAFGRPAPILSVMAEWMSKSAAAVAPPEPKGDEAASTPRVA